MTKPNEIRIPELALEDTETVQQHAYRRLRNAIMLGTIAPGTDLTIRGLATALGLSPTPVREAIRRLSSESALEVLGNRRLRIPEMDAARFDELIRLRIMLETFAAERALPHVSDIMITDLAKIDDAMDRAIAEDHLTELTRLNYVFHRNLYLANPNPQALPAIESMWLQLGPFHRQVINKVRDFYSVDHHKEIIAALRKRDNASLALALENDIRAGIGHAGLERLKEGRDEIA